MCLCGDGCMQRPDDLFIPQDCLFVCFETLSFIDLEINKRAKLAVQRAPGICLSSQPQCWDYKHILQQQAILCEFWDLTQVPLYPASQAY